MKLNSKIRAELIRHKATPTQVFKYCARVREASYNSKNWSGAVVLHHILPKNCGWWNQFKNAKWNLIPVAYPLHIGLHAYLAFIFPSNVALRRATVAAALKGRYDIRKHQKKEQICAWYKKGKSSTWIAKQIGVNYGSVLQWLRVWGVSIRTQSEAKTSPKKAKYKTYVIDSYVRGKSTKALAKHVGVTSCSILDWLHEWGIPTPRRPRSLPIIRSRTGAK